VVLDRPRRVEPELVGEHCLLERVGVRLLLAGARQRRRHRQLEEDANFIAVTVPSAPYDRPMAEITHRFVDTNGIHMHIAEAGPADGPLVVLCHGFPESWYSWRHQIGALADAGYHVVAPDQRGYGQTDALRRSISTRTSISSATSSASSMSSTPPPAVVAATTGARPSHGTPRSGAPIACGR
jgi:predicted alpha/beta-fold hydrolase